MELVNMATALMVVGCAFAVAVIFHGLFTGQPLIAIIVNKTINRREK